MVDIKVIDEVGGAGCYVGNHYIADPTDEESAFVSKWRKSDERKHKSNLFGFLKFTFAARRKFEGGGVIAKETAALVRLALIAFADGREAEGLQANEDAWCQYMIARDASHRPFNTQGISQTKTRRSWFD